MKISKSGIVFQVLLNLCTFATVWQLFNPVDTDTLLAIAPLVPLAAAAGLSALGGLFGGGGRPELTEEQKYAIQQYKALIEGGGYLPGQREQATAQLSGQLGAREALETSLLNERLASIPGARGTAFADAQRAQLEQANAQALLQSLSGLDIAAKERMLGAIGGIGSMQPGQVSQPNAFDVFGTIGGATLPVFAYQFGQSQLPAGGASYPSSYPGPGRIGSSIAFKTGVTPPIDRGKMLDAIEKMPVRKFRYKPGIEDSGAEEHLGVMAEETPYPISDGMSVDMMSMMAAIVAAVQELAQELDRVREFARRGKEIRKVESEIA